MLPFDLTNGWTVVADGKRLEFEACWQGAHVVSTLEIDGTDVVITPVAGGPALVMPLDLFELLTTRAIVIAHSTP